MFLFFYTKVTLSSRSAGPVFLTLFMQYSITFCSRLLAASDVIPGVIVDEVNVDVVVKHGDSMSNQGYSPAHFVPEQCSFVVSRFVTTMRSNDI